MFRQVDFDFTQTPPWP